VSTPINCYYWREGGHRTEGRINEGKERRPYHKILQFEVPARRGGRKRRGLDGYEQVNGEEEGRGEV
jgi:hypothetical protein